MSFDSLLALVGLAAAIYAIMPRARQLDLLLRIETRDWAAVIAGLLAIHYLLFFDVFSSLGLSPRLGLYRWNITPSLVAYVVTLLVIAFLVVSLRRFRLTERKLNAFKSLLEELSTDDGYPHLFLLLDNHLDALHTIAKRPPESGDGARPIASSILHVVLTQERIVHQLVLRRPYLGVRLLILQVHEVHEFCDTYFRTLIDVPGSPWYSELQNNTNSGLGGYYINPENRLLHTLLSDARIAEQLAVYRPIGNRTIAELERRGRLGVDDDYNWAMDDFYDEGKWRSPLWTAIRFFDIMVSAALWQGITWHMWLYYYPAFAEAIVANYQVNRDRFVDVHAEWPTKYSFLLYEIVANLRDWIQALEHLSLDQENVRLENESADHENGNIPKSAILALGQVLRHTTLSDAIPEKFRAYLLRIAFSLYFDLMKKDQLRPYATVLRESLINGGPYISPADRNILVPHLIQAFSTFDRGPYLMSVGKAVREFQAFLEASVGDAN